MTLEEVNNVDDLIDNLEKIEPPSQLASAFGDSLLHKYLLLKPAEATEKRLELWLARGFDEALEEVSYERSSSWAYEKELLDALLVYTRRTKVKDSHSGRATRELKCSRLYSQSLRSSCVYFSNAGGIRLKFLWCLICLPFYSRKNLEVSVFSCKAETPLTLQSSIETSCNMSRPRTRSEILES